MQRAHLVYVTVLALEAMELARDVRRPDSTFSPASCAEADELKHNLPTEDVKNPP